MRVAKVRKPMGRKNQCGGQFLHDIEEDQRQAGQDAAAGQWHSYPRQRRPRRQAEAASSFFIARVDLGEGAFGGADAERAGSEWRIPL